MASFLYPQSLVVRLAIQVMCIYYLSFPGMSAPRKAGTASVLLSILTPAPNPPCRAQCRRSAGARRRRLSNWDLQASSRRLVIRRLWSRAELSELPRGLADRRPKSEAWGKRSGLRALAWARERSASPGVAAVGAAAAAPQAPSGGGHVPSHAHARREGPGARGNPRADWPSGARGGLSGPRPPARPPYKRPEGPRRA